MKKLSVDALSDVLMTSRKKRSLSQAQLSELTGVNRLMIGKIENKEYIPSINQLQSLAEVLGFDITDLFVEETVTFKEGTDKELPHSCGRNRICRPVHRHAFSPAQSCDCGGCHSRKSQTVKQQKIPDTG